MWAPREGARSITQLHGSNVGDAGTTGIVNKQQGRAGPSYASGAVSEGRNLERRKGSGANATEGEKVKEVKEAREAAEKLKPYRKNREK